MIKVHMNHPAPVQTNRFSAVWRCGNVNYGYVYQFIKPDKFIYYFHSSNVYFFMGCIVRMWMQKKAPQAHTAVYSVKPCLNVQKERIVLISVKLSCCKPSGIIPENILTNIFGQQYKHVFLLPDMSVCVQVCVHALQTVVDLDQLRCSRRHQTKQKREKTKQVLSFCFRRTFEVEFH